MFEKSSQNSIRRQLKTMQFGFSGWFDALITNDDNCSATIDDLEARVPGLSEGKWYQFRKISHDFTLIS